MERLSIRYNHTLSMWGVLRGYECLALFKEKKHAEEFFREVTASKWERGIGAA